MSHTRLRREEIAVKTEQLCSNPELRTQRPVRAYVSLLHRFNMFLHQHQQPMPEHVYKAVDENLKHIENNISEKEDECKSTPTLILNEMSGLRKDVIANFREGNYRTAGLCFFGYGLNFAAFLASGVQEQGHRKLEMLSPKSK